jgi:hypothetical protein
MRPLMLARLERWLPADAPAGRAHGEAGPRQLPTRNTVRGSRRQSLCCEAVRIGGLQFLQRQGNRDDFTLLNSIRSGLPRQLDRGLRPLRGIGVGVVQSEPAGFESCRAHQIHLADRSTTG